jgi:hypothetical protein
MAAVRRSDSGTGMPGSIGARRIVRTRVVVPAPTATRRAGASPEVAGAEHQHDQRQRRVDLDALRED